MNQLFPSGTLIFDRPQTEHFYPAPQLQAKIEPRSMRKCWMLFWRAHLDYYHRSDSDRAQRLLGRLRRLLCDKLARSESCAPSARMVAVSRRSQPCVSESFVRDHLKRRKPSQFSGFSFPGITEEVWTSDQVAGHAVSPSRFTSPSLPNRFSASSFPIPCLARITAIPTTGG